MYIIKINFQAPWLVEMRDILVKFLIPFFEN